jgi:hypothetical protein
VSRRSFPGVAAAAAAARPAAGSPGARADAGRTGDPGPWFRRTRRWVRTNLNEQDPAPGRLLLHVVNLTDPAAFRPYATDLRPVGPRRVRVAPPAGLAPVRARRLVAGGEAPCAREGGWVTLRLEPVLDHEVVVLE